MSFKLTERAQIASEKIDKHPSLILVIDGVEKKYGSAKILKLIKIGDEDLLIGDDWVIGGFRPLKNQLTCISMEDSSNSIKQQLDIDKGRGSSISSLEIALIDFKNQITELITPGEVVDDILGRKAKLYLGFADNTNFPDDFIIIFRGIIDNINSEAGVVKLNLAHPDQKKRQLLYSKKETQLNGAISNSDTTLTVDSTLDFLLRVNGPSGSPDTSFTSYIRIDNEIIKYTGKTGTTFTGCTRGALSTIASSHSDNSRVDSFYTLEGNAIDLALKMMLSGWQGYFQTGVDITNFNVIGDSTVVSNSMFFSGINVEYEYGVVVGDYLTTTGATNGANNVSMKTISQIEIDDYGTYIVVNGVSFVNEASTSATVSFRSQYDSLPSGLKMSCDEVDVAEHERIKTLFLSSFDYKFYLKDSIEDAQEFLEQQIYKPAGAYSLPRKARASLGYFIGPIPSVSSKLLDESNITNPNKLKIRRSTNKNFFNTIVYKFEVDPLEDKYLRGVFTQSTVSLGQIPIGTKPLVIQADGMREDLVGVARATSASNRRLDRFKFGAEFLEGVNINYEFGFNLEVGDIVLLDGSQLSLSDTETGTRGKATKMFEIVNKSLSFKTGNVVLDLVDTGFAGSSRYATIAPSSKIKSGISSTQFIIEQYYKSPYGVNEYKKWERYDHCRVKVVSPDFTTRFAQSYIQSISGNTITLNASLGFTPQPGDMMTLADYDFAGVTDQIKLLYTHMHDTPNFGDSSELYVML